MRRVIKFRQLDERALILLSRSSQPTSPESAHTGIDESNALLYPARRQRFLTAVDWYSTGSRILLYRRLLQNLKCPALYCTWPAVTTTSLRLGRRLHGLRRRVNTYNFGSLPVPRSLTFQAVCNIPTIPFGRDAFRTGSDVRASLHTRSPLQSALGGLHKGNVFPPMVRLLGKPIYIFRSTNIDLA